MQPLVQSISNHSNSNLTQEQLQQINKAENYLQQHKIHQICNVASP